ncbi:MAG: ABC transporter substrate-binding protein [Gammaproteobacteria bacterium]
MKHAILKTILGGAVALSVCAPPALAADKTLKIGFVGVTSGPKAAWGISNVRCMETRAKWINEEGGISIGGDTYDIEIVKWDTQDNTTRAKEGMEKMVQEGIRYVIGPNTDPTAAAVRPVAEKDGVMYFPYAFPKELYTQPASNAVLGMIANYQSGPAIYKYLKENKGVKTIAFLAANESDALSQRAGGVEAAKALGLEVVAEDAYQSDTRDFTPVVTPIVREKPDLLVLSGVAGGTAPLIIRAARELGYAGFMSTETAQDAKQLQEGAGDLADGFISVGGASTPEIRSAKMEEFIRRYTEDHGQYDDESNTKVYAMEYILETLKANPKGLDDVKSFQKTMDTLSVPNPFLKGDEKLEFVGSFSFGQKRQVGVPMVVNEFRGGEFQTLFVTKVD